MRYQRVRRVMVVSGILVALLMAPTGGATGAAQSAAVAELEKVWVFAVTNLASQGEGNRWGDDLDFPDPFTACLFDDHTWVIIDACDEGRWMSDKKMKRTWLQGGCPDFDVYTAIDIKGKKKGKGFVHEWFGATPPFTHIAAHHRAVRGDKDDFAACEAFIAGDARSKRRLLR